MPTSDKPFSVQTWTTDMEAAVTDLCDLGRTLLQTHMQANDTAAEKAEHWQLPERQAAEHAAMKRLFANVRTIIEANEACSQLLHNAETAEAELHQAISRSSHLIESKLPEIEQDYAAIRHSALDLLYWAEHIAPVEGSDLPSRYRAGHARFVAYKDVFRERMACLQKDLRTRHRGPVIPPEVRSLITNLTHYDAVMESARGFIQSVVNPPMQLVFEDTESFAQDWQTLTPEKRGTLGTSFNDCCQLLLYDVAAFHKRVEQLRPDLGEGMEASLYVLTVDESKILFTVDEDPVFEEIRVTLFRVVSVDAFSTAYASVTKSLYDHLFPSE